MSYAGLDLATIQLFDLRPDFIVVNVCPYTPFITDPSHKFSVIASPSTTTARHCPPGTCAPGIIGGIHVSGWLDSGATDIDPRRTIAYF
jgi:hypothetical protein